MSQTFIKIGALKLDASEYEVPSERTFRNAWTIDNPTSRVITVDMTKAREICRDKIREARIPEFARLDAEFMKALETGADTSAIAAQKQALRDAPAHPGIDGATTPEELVQFFRTYAGV